MGERRYWAIINFLLAALNVGLFLQAPGAGSVYNLMIAVLLGGLGYWHLGHSPRRGLALPHMRQLPDHLFPEAVVLREQRKKEALAKAPTPPSRALRLLMSYLTPAQQREYLTHRHFTFQTPSGKWMRIWPTTYYGVQELGGPRGPAILSYCAYPRGAGSKDLPIEDGVLGTYLLLMSNEKRFFMVANRGQAGNTDMSCAKSMLTRLPPEVCELADLDSICIQIDKAWRAQETERKALAQKRAVIIDNCECWECREWAQRENARRP